MRLLLLGFKLRHRLLLVVIQISEYGTISAQVKCTLTSNEAGTLFPFCCNSCTCLEKFSLLPMVTLRYLTMIFRNWITVKDDLFWVWSFFFLWPGVLGFCLRWWPSSTLHTSLPYEPFYQIGVLAIYCSFLTYWLCRWNTPGKTISLLRAFRFDYSENCIGIPD